MGNTKATTYSKRKETGIIKMVVCFCARVISLAQRDETDEGTERKRIGSRDSVATQKERASGEREKKKNQKWTRRRRHT